MRSPLVVPVTANWTSPALSRIADANVPRSSSDVALKANARWVDVVGADRPTV
jgi:hypothetical protein